MKQEAISQWEIKIVVEIVIRLSIVGVVSKKSIETISIIWILVMKIVRNLLIMEANPFVLCSV